jgi:CheY-like chemotaxis protein
LIVDDDAFNLFALKQLIQRLGEYECDTASTGKEAVDKVVQKQDLPPHH